jgi:hypothetical protein
MTLRPLIVASRTDIRFYRDFAADSDEGRAAADDATFGNCCGDPKPRIGEQSGRVFCATCRRYLDARPATPDGSSAPQVAEAGNRASLKAAAVQDLGDAEGKETA